MANKDFVVKNSLIVGDTATINGVQLNPSGATSGQVLKFDGTKFAPGTAGDVGGSSYYQTIGNGTNSSFTLTHNLGTRDVTVTVRNADSPYEVINVRWEAETTNTVVLDFSSPPSASSVRVGIYAALSGTAIPSIYQIFSVPSTLSSGTGKGRFYANRSLTIANVSASVGTAPTGSSIIIDVLKNGSTIFTTTSNRPTITAGSFVDISSIPDSGYDTMVSGDYLTVSIIQVGSTISGSDLTLQVELQY